MYSGGKISNISFLNVTFMNNLIPFISNKMYNKLFLTEYRDLSRILRPLSHHNTWLCFHLINAQFSVGIDKFSEINKLLDTLL